MVKRLNLLLQSIDPFVSIIILIILIAALFRFYNLSWDNFHYFHPDERNIALAVSKIKFFSSLNPQFFAYGGFSVYLYAASASLISFLAHNHLWTADWGYINLTGRFLSAFFSTLTIIPLFLLSQKLFSKNVALLASLFYALSVSSIQYAHFDTTESLLIFLVTLISLISLILLEKPNVKTVLVAGMVLGVAVATKTTALLFAFAPLLAILLKGRLPPVGKIRNLLILAGSSFITFLVLSPYTFLDWKKFWESFNYESGVATGRLPVPYTLQFTHTLPYLFQLENFFWSLGPVFIIASIGFLYLIYKTFKNKNKALLVFLSIPVLYFLYVGSWYAKFIRYMAPLLPFWIIFLSYLLKTIKKRFKTLGGILIFVSILLTALWALAFISIYSHPQTRVLASEWIYKNIPAGSFIFQEHWDDGLPLPLGLVSPQRYKIEQLTIYQPDDRQKELYYATKLSQGDYIVISSRRLYGTLINLPEKYPLTGKYYQLLFAEKLGYQKVAEFSSYPQLLGIKIDDDKSEETFQVYDHPKSIIFKNTAHLSANQYLLLLRSAR